MIKYIIGIDAGGTSCKGIAYTENKEVIAKAMTGSGSAAVVSEEKVWHNVLEAINLVYNQIDKTLYQLVFIQIGLTAFSILKENNKIKEHLKKAYQVPCDICGDTILALYATIKDQYENGVVAISGTGVAIFGKNQSETCLIGGWGQILRELGSAYATIHKLALDIIDKTECEIPLNDFEQAFLRNNNMQSAIDLKELFYFNSKDEIAGLVNFVKKAALNGDTNAKTLLFKQGELLAIQTIRAIKKLKLKDNYCLGLKGGFVQHQNEDICEGFLNELKKHQIRVPIIINDEEPIIGTYYLAKKGCYL